MKKTFFTPSPCNAIGADVLQQRHRSSATAGSRPTREGRD
jgi:hypothetical protein